MHRGRNVDAIAKIMKKFYEVLKDLIAGTRLKAQGAWPFDCGL